MPRKIQRYFYLTILILGFLSFSGATFAQSQTITTNGEEIRLETPQPKISIPGLKFGEPKISTNGNGEDQLIDVPFLGQYIAAVYKYAVAIAGIIAVVMIIIAGFQWATSGGSADAISEAKKRISNAIIGLILTLSSYVILYTVNPELVSFKNLRVQYVQTKDVQWTETAELTNSDITAEIQFSSEFPPGLIPIPNLPNVTYGGGVTAAFRYGRKDMVEAFVKAMSDFKERYPERKVQINSGLRDAAYQQRLANQSSDAAKTVKTDSNGKLTAPINISHTGGNAFDLQVFFGKEFIPLGVLCNTVKDDAKILLSKNAQRSKAYGSEHCIVKEHQQLIGVMLNHGFCVGLKATAPNRREGWHFEYPGPELKLSPFCAFKNEANASEGELYYAYHLDK